MNKKVDAAAWWAIGFGTGILTGLAAIWLGSL